MSRRAGTGTILLAALALTLLYGRLIAPLLAWLAENGAVELDSRELSLEEVFLEAYEPAT